MKRVFNSDKKILILLWLIVFAIFLLTYGKMGNLYIDCGREAYIPWQMLKGNVLYKDIFNIYAPGAYLINALLYKIFTPNLHVLYIAAALVYAGIISFTYMISRQFLCKINSFMLMLSILLLTAVSGNVFNFYFPYSFAVIYGLFFILCSLYFLLKRDKSSKDYYLAAFFAGLAAVNKYEYIPFIIPLLFFTVKHIKNIKGILTSLLCYVVAPIISLGILLIQGITLYDIKKEFFIISEFFASKSFKFFYESSGLVLSSEHLPLVLGTAIVSFIAFIIALKIKPVWLKFSLLFAVLVFAKLVYSFKIFVYLPFLIVIIFIYRYKKLNTYAKTLFFCYLMIVLKVFSALMLFSYGEYFVGISLVVLCALLPINYRRMSLLCLFVYSILMSSFSFDVIFSKRAPLVTENGIIFSTKVLQKPFIQVYDYLKENSAPDDIVLAFPEMPMLNFLLQRDNDNYLFSLIPMYVEIFGEDNIIARIQDVAPRYIVINNFIMKSYGVNYFGKDYAVKIMDYIKQNYNIVFETHVGLKHRVYRRK